MREGKKSIPRKTAYILALLMMFLWSRGISAPMDSAAIAGTVKDSSGASVSGAKVSLTLEGEPVSIITGTTSADGTYSFEHLSPGAYTVVVEFPGYRNARREKVDLTSPRKVVIDLTLTPDHPPTVVGVPGPGERGPALEVVGYDDKPQMRPAGITGSIDPGGYSAAEQADRGSQLLRSVAGLKSDSTGNPEKRAQDPASAKPRDVARLELNLEAAVKAHPENFEANHRLGEFYVHAGELASGIPYLEKAYRLDPSHYVNAYDLALAYLETRNYPAARNQLQSMIQSKIDLRRQDTAELHGLLAEVEETTGNFLQAANEYERAAHLDPNEKNIFDWGCELLLHRAMEPAMEVFKRGLERHPSSSKLWIGLGIALYSRGQYDAAVKAFAQATDLEPSDPRPYLFLAKVYNISSTEAHEVTARLRRFTELEPRNAQAVYYYALSLWKGERGTNPQPNLEQVESLLKRATELDPRFPDAHLQLGILYADRKDYSQAIREYRRAIELEPDLVDAHYRLGQAFVRSGEKARAQEEFAAYDRLHKQQLAETEKQRGEIRQFIFTMKGSPENQGP